jgi:hypothetical protein
LNRLEVGLTELAILREILGFLTKENSSGNSNFRGCPYQQSSQRRHEAPSATETEAMPLNLSRSFRISFHQKEPFFDVAREFAIGIMLFPD